MTARSTDRKCRSVEQYLLDRTADGPAFVKSKFIAEEMELSAREIGASLGKLDERSSRLEIERWSYTNATTWRVERA